MHETTHPAPVRQLNCAKEQPVEVAVPAPDTGISRVPNRVLRKPEVVRLTGVPNTTRDGWIENGLFPAPVRLGPRNVGWLESDILTWINSRKPTKIVQQATTAPTATPRRRGRQPQAVAANSQTQG